MAIIRHPADNVAMVEQHGPGGRTGRLVMSVSRASPTDLTGAIRHLIGIILLLVGVLIVAGSFVFSVDHMLLPPIVLLLIVAVVGAAVPWESFPQDAFVLVGLGVAASAVWLVALTDGARSPFVALFLVALGHVTLVVRRRLATVVGFAITGLAALPFAYEHVGTRDGLALGLWVGLGALTSFVMPLLMADVRDAIRRASYTAERLSVEQLTSAELSRSQEARKEYMSVLAHELRNPLVGIGAAARVMAGQVAGTPAESSATGIVAEVQHALALLDALTDVSSIEDDRLRSALRPIDIGVVVREAVAALGAVEHPVSCVGIEHPVMVLGDERRLGQVLRNLVGNAAKYSPSGTPIEVRVGRRPDGRSIIIAVKDAGPGVPPPERARLFEKFARLSTAGATRGSGLGLYISREIVKDHGGTMSVDWPAGGGSVFSFSLSVADGAAVPAGS